MFVIANAPYSYFFAPGFDTLGNVVGHHSWWVCYMPWKNMGMTMQSMNTSENFISNLKKALCDPSGKFYGTYPSYSQVCSHMKSIGQTGATPFPDNYPFFT